MCGCVIRFKLLFRVLKKSKSMSTPSHIIHFEQLTRVGALKSQWLKDVGATAVQVLHLFLLLVWHIMLDLEWLCFWRSRKLCLNFAVRFLCSSRCFSVAGYSSLSVAWSLSYLVNSFPFGFKQQMNHLCDDVRLQRMCFLRSFLHYISKESKDEKKNDF